jgi:hypothetical protein
VAYTGTLAQSPLGGAVAINSGTASAPTWTDIGEVKAFAWSGRENKTADATNLSSTAVEFIATLPDSGTWEVTTNRVGTDAGQVAVEAAWRSRATNVQFRLTYPKLPTQATTGDTYVVKAIVQNATPAPSFNPDAVIDYKFTIKVNGLDTFTAGA